MQEHTHTQICLNTSCLTQSANCMAIVQLSDSFVTDSRGENSALSAIFAVTQGVPGQLLIDLDNILCCFGFPSFHS